jgi:serine/alanine adding enzyme
MSVRLAETIDEMNWDGFVSRSLDSSCYHLMGWKKVVENSFGHKTFYLVSENGGREIDGVLPLVQLKSLLFGNFMVSLPFFNYGGVCSSDRSTKEVLIKEAAAIAESNGINHIELRHTVPLENGLPVKSSKVAMKLTLPENVSCLWRTFPAKLRSQIKRPEREGMRTKWGKKEELESFYRVFSINMRDLGTPVYSKAFFRNIMGYFPETSWICTVYDKQDRAVASGFLVGFRDTLEIPWASSLREYNRQSPNMLLYWNCLKVACEKGFRVFDFGRSTPGEGTYKFKEQWGAKPVPLHWYYWLRNGSPLPELNPKNPKYQLAIKVWKSLPLGFTKLIGPHIVKYLP